MRIVLGTLQGLSLLEIGDTPFGDNTSVARLEVEGDDIRVLYRDDNSHLLQAGLSTLAKQTTNPAPTRIFFCGVITNPPVRSAAGL